MVSSTCEYSVPSVWCTRVGVRTKCLNTFSAHSTSSVDLDKTVGPSCDQVNTTCEYGAIANRSWNELTRRENKAGLARRSANLATTTPPVEYRCARFGHLTLSASCPDKSHHRNDYSLTERDPCQQCQMFLFAIVRYTSITTFLPTGTCLSRLRPFLSRHEKIKSGKQRHRPAARHKSRIMNTLCLITP